jgi:hypothetical protein
MYNANKDVYLCWRTTIHPTENAVDRETLLAAIREGPIVVHMNDGSRYEIASAEFATVSDIAAAVLVKDADGKLRHRLLSLVCMFSVEPLAAA